MTTATYRRRHTQLSKPKLLKLTSFCCLLRHSAKKRGRSLYSFQGAGVGCLIHLCFFCNEPALMRVYPFWCAAIFTNTYCCCNTLVPNLGINYPNWVMVPFDLGNGLFFMRPESIIWHGKTSANCRITINDYSLSFVHFYLGLQPK